VFFNGLGMCLSDSMCEALGLIGGGREGRERERERERESSEHPATQ
jgi:hypothetical protein